MCSTKIMEGTALAVPVAHEYTRLHPNFGSIHGELAMRS